MMPLHFSLRRKLNNLAFANEYPKDAWLLSPATLLIWFEKTLLAEPKNGLEMKTGIRTFY